MTEHFFKRESYAKTCAEYGILIFEIESTKAEYFFFVRQSAKNLEKQKLSPSTNLSTLQSQLLNYYVIAWKCRTGFPADWQTKERSYAMKKFSA